jgi:inositol 1,4,5-triphosphate receptor type 1
VIKSVTRNGRSIILTAILALILVYLFSIIGYLFFRNDYQMEVEPSIVDLSNSFDLSVEPSIVDENHNDFSETVNTTIGYCQANNNSCYNQTNQTIDEMPHKYDNILLDLITEDNKESKKEEENDAIKERACDSLLMCIITTLNQGLRNGGGIGDVLRSPSSAEPLFMARVIYDLLFFFIVIIIILNLIFGVIIDTFADLRSEKQQKEEIIKNTCFICGMFFFIKFYYIKSNH